MRPTLEERFWSKVNKTETCWLWTASTHSGGYGQFNVAGRMVRAHRLAYELTVGPISPGLVLDHLCRIKRCVNPAHLEQVTQAENVRRGDHGPGRPRRPGRATSDIGSFWRAKTHCPQGHPYDESNTYRAPNGCRNCRTCKQERTRLARLEKRTC